MGTFFPRAVDKLQQIIKSHERYVVYFTPKKATTNPAGNPTPNNPQKPVLQPVYFSPSELTRIPLNTGTTDYELPVSSARFSFKAENLEYIFITDDQGLSEFRALLLQTENAQFHVFSSRDDTVTFEKVN